MNRYLIDKGTRVQIGNFIDGSMCWREHVMRKTLAFPSIAWADETCFNFKHEGWTIRVPKKGEAANR